MAYSANRGSSNGNMSYNQEQMSPEDAKKQKQQEATKDALKVAAKGAGAYFGGAAGAAVVSKAADTKLGDKVLNEGANKLNKIPGVAKKTEALKDSGATDMADKAVDTIGAKGGKGAAGAGGANASNAAGGANAGNAAKGQNTNAGDKTPASSDANKSGKLASSAGANSRRTDSNINEESDGAVEESEVLISAQAKKVLVLGAIFLPVITVVLLIVVIIAAIGGVTGDYEDAIAAYSASGGDTGGVIYEPSSDEAKAFYERIDEAKSSMESEGEQLDIVKLVAVYHVINRRESSYDYDYFTTSRLKDIAREITTDREETKNNLAQNVFPGYFPGNTNAQNEQMADEVFEYIDNYKSMVGITEEDEEYYDDYSDCVGGTGVCTYDIKGFNIGGSIHKKKMSIDNLQVKLMQCGSPYGNGSYTKAINQPLVPFENYVTGVTYAEIGTGYKKDAQQAQMIAARSFALARPTAMGNSLGKKLSKVNGKWILQISSCVADQVFCNVDQGCSYMGGGDGQGGYVVSGTGKGIRSNNPLPSNSKTRQYSNEVQGMVLTDKNGYVVSTNFTSTEQEQMRSLANQGLDYKQILLKMYPRATSIYKANCGTDSCSGATGDYAKWRQWDKRWAKTPMGSSGKTLGDIGCLATSVSMLIAKSGVPTTNVSGSFNPGSFVKAMNKVGGIDNQGLYQWYATSKVVPKFQHVGRISVSGKSKAEKLKTAKDLTSKGYYVVAEVKGGTPGNEHWVAIDRVNNDSMVIMDPGYGKTRLWDTFYKVEKTSTFAYFKVA